MVQQYYLSVLKVDQDHNLRNYNLNHRISKMAPVIMYTFGLNVEFG